MIRRVLGTFPLIIALMFAFPVAVDAHGGHTAEHNHPYPKKQFSVHNGEKIYDNNCAMCHGTVGNGAGEAADGLTPSPTNFLDLKYMPMRSRVDHFEAIKNGRTNTSMPPWSDALTDGEIWDAIAYIEHLFNHQSDVPSQSAPSEHGVKNHAH